MQMTYVGAPMVYYGDEVGMWGGNDPDDRKPMVWDDIEYADEIYNADGSTHAPDKVEINHDLLSHYKKLIHIRKDNPVLQMGSYRLVLADDENCVLIFERAFEGETMFVVINNSDSDQIIDVPELKGSFTDLLSGDSFSEGVEISVPKKWGLILKHS